MRFTAIAALALLVVHVPDALAQKKPARDRNRITHEEIVSSGAKSTTQLVRKLRPFWLSNRGNTDLQSGGINREQAVNVYVDGLRRGPVNAELEAVPLEQVEELRYYSGEAATTRFGMDNDLGAIEIITKK